MFKLKQKDPLITMKLYDPITMFEWYPLQFSKKKRTCFWFIVVNWNGEFGIFDMKLLYQWNQIPFTTTSRIEKTEYKRPIQFSELFGSMEQYTK